MTSSNDNKDSSLPHAASRLVLYTKLKKKGEGGQKATDKETEKEQRRKEVERILRRGWGASCGSGSELADPSGPL